MFLGGFLGGFFGFFWVGFLLPTLPEGGRSTDGSFPARRHGRPGGGQSPAQDTRATGRGHDQHCRHQITRREGIRQQVR
jgi:hypothetical protein